MSNLSMLDSSTATSLRMSSCETPVLAGQGTALLPTFIGDAEPGLRRAGPVVPELTHDQWLVAHEADRHLPEVRRAIDRMCRVLERLGG